jgi:hypothetical protein
LGVEETGVEQPFDVLSGEVTGFAVRYRHPRSNAWEEKWEEKNMVPAAIEYTITFGGNDPRVTAVTAVRQIELPAAAYTVNSGGAAPSEQQRSGRVLRRDVAPVSGSSGRGGSDIPGVIQ